MLTKDQMKQIIVDNFNDLRITSIQCYVQSLLERKSVTVNDSITKYRMKNIATGNDITSIDEFLAAITPDSITFGYHLYSEGMSGDRVHPLHVGLNNISVTLDPYSPDDTLWSEMVGRMVDGRISFYMNYLTDMDPVLPLKIFEVRIHSK